MLNHHQNFIKHFRIKENPSDFELKLLEKTKKYIAKISWIPGLEMVGVCNTLSMYCTKPTSDIDLFIITSKNRVWLVRFLITTVFYILGVWRKDETNSAGNFCLSFFVDENNLDFSKIAIENDIYLFYWIYYLKPILNKNNAYEKFIEANRSLGINKEDLPKDRLDYIIKRRERLHRSGSGELNSFGSGGMMQSFLTINKFYDFIDWFGYFIYTKIFKYISPKTKKVRRPFGVIISREMLKFHDTDKREEIRDRLIGSENLHSE